MINHNQKLDNTLKYLTFMVSDIKEYQSNLGDLEDESRCNQV